MQRRTIGDYELLETLGTGTVGTAFRARHQSTGQVAAIKLLRGHVASDPDIQRRFVREVAISEKLDHPNIVRHFDAGLHEDQIFFAMEWVECGTLKEVLKERGTLPWRDAVECAIQMCAALGHAHQLGIIHRDLKPANLFLSESGKVKVGDFGLARDLASTRLTMDGQTVGTALYMPPEQITGEADLTGATDLYALGCILYEMVVGQTPFHGHSTYEVFERHLSEEPVPPTSLVRDCPDGLSKLILLLMAKDPKARPSSAAATQAALENILHGKSMPNELCAAKEVSKSAGVAAKNGETLNLTQRLKHGMTPQPRQVSYKTILILLGIAAVVLLVAVLLATLL